jgi:hypothetical protein
VVFVDGERPIAVARREFDGARHVARHLLFDIVPGYQGAGIAKVFVRNSVALYRRIGVQRVEALANLTVGGYAWARYGFLPKPGEWGPGTPLCDHIQHRIVSIQMSPAVRATAEQLLTVQDSRALWAVADQPYHGAQLLIGSRWAGYLDLTDADVLARLARYTQ